MPSFSTNLWQRPLPLDRIALYASSSKEGIHFNNIPQRSKHCIQNKPLETNIIYFARYYVRLVAPNNSERGLD